MQLNHVFTVPVGVEEAWAVLRDIERVAPCMPGATVESVEGDTFTGRVKVKVGPMQITYRGSAAFAQVDEARHRATIEAKGQEARGSGTANATVTAELLARDGWTEVTVITDLAVTGKPAQFGRGVMAEVGEKLLGQFADCLAATLGDASAADAGAVSAAAPVADAPAPDAGRPVPPAAARFGEEEWVADEPLDLIGMAGAPIARRVVPVALGVFLFGLVWWLVRRAD